MLSNKFTVGGGERKVQIYSQGLNKKYFEIYFVFLDDGLNVMKKDGDKFIVSKDKLVSFIKKNSIDIFYSFTAKLSNSLISEIKDSSIYINSVNFTPLYDSDLNSLNLIISKTDFLKIKDLNESKMNNAYVVYNPINTSKWIKLNSKSNSYRNYFKNKNIKFVVGRLGRAEPTKWSFLILATLFKLSKNKNYNYGFVFAGIPLLYRKFLNLLVSKRFKENILYLPQLVGDKDLAKFYNSIDLFWQTSYIGESFGNVIAESFCFKVPVITDFKNFYRSNGSVNPKWYNAQMELVDHNKNGFYVNYPSSIINCLDSLNLKKLNKLGTNGYNKALKNYDVKLACKTIEKVFFLEAKKRNLISKIPSYYEKLEMFPEINEVNSFKKEYFRKLKIAKNNNKISKLSYIFFKFFEKSWNFIEFSYVIIRKLLRKVFKFDLESF